MGVEIEHKYLVKSDKYKDYVESTEEIIQGYLSKDSERVVRVRIKGNIGYLTIKSKTENSHRHEYEYEIPYKDALELMNLCIGEPIKKIRSIIYYQGFRWEIDEFCNKNIPTIAEIELPSSDTIYPLPDFIGENVSGNPAYYNSNI